LDFSRRRRRFNDFDHPEYKDLISINEELYASEMNGFQRTNQFLVRLYPNKKFVKDRDPLIEPSVELVWLLQMDIQLIEGLQNSEFTPFKPPTMLLNL